MSVTSANIPDLEQFVNGSDQRSRRLADSLNVVAANARLVMGACSGAQFPSTPSLSSLDHLIGMWMINREFVRVVRDELLRADGFDASGNATVSDAAITASLRTAGLPRARDVIEVPEIELFGQPPYSGFVDDPICLANGNFLLRDGDIEVFGLSSVLSVLRTYNSRDDRTGSFGPGWSSLLDTSLLIEDGCLTFRGPDGGGSVFRRQEDGSWFGGRRRRQELRSEGAGWTLTEGHERTWTFDGEGTLVSCTALGAAVTVTRASDELTLVERTSGRWVRYVSDGNGTVTAAVTSDGREARYRYDPSGRLVGVERDRGAVAYAYDEHGFLASVVDADGLVVFRNTYDAEGGVLTQVEQHGRETRYEYRESGVAVVTPADGGPPNVMVHDRRGRLTAMIDGLGATMRLAYDHDDNVVQVVDRTGAETCYEHDERGNVVRRVDPDGIAVEFTWDHADRLVSEVDRAGASTRYVYEGHAREPTSVVQADGSEVSITLNDLGLPTSIVDADGVSARLEWDRDGLLTAMVDGLGARTTFDYDAAGRSIGAAAPEGIRATLTLDVAGRVLALRTTDGEQRFAYSAAGRTSGGVDLAGTAWSAEYDDAGDLVELSDAEGRLLRLERDLVGQVTATSDADGARAQVEHDASGRRTAVIDPEGNPTRIDYDPEGRPTQVTDASGRRARRELDVLGRTTAAIAPGGATQTRRYHAHGELASVTDAAGNSWRYEIDLMGRVVSSVDPLGHETTYRYSRGGRLVEVRSPMGRVLRREYDAAGRLARIEEPDGTEVTFERRADGAIVRVLRDGAVTSLDYDEAGRSSAIAGPWGSVEVERAAGDVVTFRRGGASAARFDYDARRLLARVADPAGVVTDFAHDDCGRLVAHTTGATTASYAWDTAGRLAGVTDVYGNRTIFERDPRGAVERIVRPDGSATTRRFGPDGLLAGATDADGAEILAVERDANGAVLAARSFDSRLSVTRDVLGRITSTETNGGTITYSWDADGYLLALADDTGHEVNVDRDDGGRALAFTLRDGRRIGVPAPVEVDRDDDRRIVADERGRRFAYDLAGRLAEATVEGEVTSYGYNDLGLLATERSSAGVRTCRYGAAGELTSSVAVDGTETTYEYDAAGRRVREVLAGGGEVTYRWDATGRLSKVSRVGTDGVRTSNEIEHDPTGRPAVIDGIPIRWDSVVTGNVVGIGEERYLWWGNQVLVATDHDGCWERRTGDDPWGDDGGVGLRLGFRGEVALDGLLFLGARVYDTRTRSFLSRDPLPSVPGALAYAGVYSYAWCDPVNYVDPSGEKPISDEDYAAIREQASKGIFRRAAEAVAEDPWRYIAKATIVVGSIVLMAVATVALGPVGLVLAGAAVGALSSGLNTAVDGGGWGDSGRSALIGGVFGAASGGLGAASGALSRSIPATASASMGTRLLTNAGLNAITEIPTAFGKEAVDSHMDLPYLGAGDGDFQFDRALLDVTIGTVAGVGFAELQYALTPQFGSLPGALDGETPASLLPDPARRSVLDINAATATDLERVHGIGPVLSQRIIDHRTATGGFTTPNDLLAIPGIGEARLDAIVGAGGVAQ